MLLGRASLDAVLLQANLLAINWENLKFQGYDQLYGSYGAGSVAKTAGQQTLLPFVDDTTVRRTGGTPAQNMVTAAREANLHRPREQIHT